MARITTLLVTLAALVLAGLPAQARVLPVTWNGFNASRCLILNIMMRYP